MTSDRHRCDSSPELGISATPKAPNRERRWLELSTAYWRERVAQWGGDEDYVGLVRVLGRVHGQGIADTTEEAYALLREAAERHPRSVAVWEHLVPIVQMAGRSAEMDEVLAVIERLDPTSRVLAIVDNISPESARGWVESVSAKQSELFEQARSADDEVADRAVAELGQWDGGFRRTRPTGSTTPGRCLSGAEWTRHVVRHCRR